MRVRYCVIAVLDFVPGDVGVPSHVSAIILREQEKHQRRHRKKNGKVPDKSASAVNFTVKSASASESAKKSCDACENEEEGTKSASNIQDDGLTAGKRTADGADAGIILELDSLTSIHITNQSAQSEQSA